MAAHEFNYAKSDFDRVRRLIYERAGISIAESKSEMVYSRLSRRLRQLGDSTFEDYLDALESGSRPDEWEAFTNSLTTNLTSFFREAHHFPMLGNLLREQPGPHRIWCSAASTGEEPYSLAITACEYLQSMSPRVEILASDIDTQVLAQGRRGVYGIDRIDGLADERKRQFFLRGTGANSGMVRVRPELQKMIDFRQVNLLADHWPVDGQFDAIFCRNVMIYFDKPTQAKVLRRFAPLLKPNGLLFLGHSENISFISPDFRLLSKTVYVPVRAAGANSAAQTVPSKPMRLGEEKAVAA